MLNITDIKECQVKLANDEVVVISFDGELIQIPQGIEKTFDRIVHVKKCDNGLYTLATKEEMEKFHSSKKNKTVKKQQTESKKVAKVEEKIKLKEEK